MTLSPNKIVEGVWIGNFYDSENVEFLDREKIEVVMNLTGGLRNLSIKRFYIVIPLDQPFGNTKADAEYAVRKLSELRNSASNTLVHCLSGKDRSPTVVARFLQDNLFDGDPKGVEEFMRAKRPGVINHLDWW